MIDPREPVGLFKRAKMTIGQKAVTTAAILATLIGCLFLCAAVYFQVRYWTEAGNAGRHELLAGVALGLLYGFVALLVSAGLAISIRRALPRPVYLALSLPALATGLTLFALYLIPLGIELIESASGGGAAR